MSETIKTPEQKPINFRDPNTAEHVDTGIIIGITDEWNTEACYRWPDGYWEIWVDEKYAKKDAILGTSGSMVLVAKGGNKDSWKKVNTAEFCKNK